MTKDEIIYSISVEDLCLVASDDVGRDLTQIEIDKISDKIGDYIDWRGAIENAISDYFVSTSV